MTTTAFKHIFGPSLVADLAARIAAVAPGFDSAGFCAQLGRELPPLELKARVAAIADALRERLPADYPEALRALLATLGPPPEEGPGMFADTWYSWPMAAFVERHGLGHPAESLAALHAITQRGSAEFAIRPFIEQHPEQAMAALRAWAHDPSFHVRRLVSEGTRTRLPWAGRLPAFIADPAPVLDLLDRLRGDPSAYVRRSVANSLNDLSKDHPDLVLATLQRWAAAPTPAGDAIARHALRGLIKQGHPQALAMLGAHTADVRLVALQLDPASLRIGDELRLSASLIGAGAAPQRLVIDYIIYFAGARGAASRRKVFKLRTLNLAPGARADLSWRLSLQHRTIRALYPGPHRVELQVNGVILGGAAFELGEPA